MNNEQVEVIETPEQLVEVLQQARTELHATREQLRVAEANELMLWRLIGQQMFTERSGDG